MLCPFTRGCVSGSLCANKTIIQKTDGGTRINICHFLLARHLSLPLPLFLSVIPHPFPFASAPVGVKQVPRAPGSPRVKGQGTKPLTGFGAWEHVAPSAGNFRLFAFSSPCNFSQQKILLFYPKGRNVYLWNNARFSMYIIIIVC